MYSKMPFFFELISVWKAMLLAYGLMDKMKWLRRNQRIMNAKIKNGFYS